MKKLITVFTLAVLAACPLAGFADGSIESDPAYLPIDKVLDLKALPPQVNLNLPRFLLKDALAGLNDSQSNSLPKSATDLADMLKDIKLLRVVVIEAKTNRAELDKAMKALQAEVDAGKWTPIAKISDSGESVGVYAMGDPSGESTSGMAVLIHDHGQAVICNIVGHVSIGKLMKLASQGNMMPTELLQKLQGGGKPADEKSEEKTAKPDSSATTNQPVDAPKPAAKDSATK